jgi:hypothetical protein
VTIVVVSRRLPDDELQGFGLPVSLGPHDRMMPYFADEAPDQLPYLVSPNCKDSLAVSFSKADWNNRTVDVEVDSRPLRGSDAAQTFIFSLTPFAAPFSDNTPLADGNRFALFQIDVQDLGSGHDAIHVMRVRLRWFPEYYYPPTERPGNPRNNQKKLNIGPLGRQGLFG